MAGTDESALSLEERVSLLTKEVDNTKEILSLLLSYLRMRNDVVDGPDFMKWCLFQMENSYAGEDALSFFQSACGVIESADMALEAEEDRGPFREASLSRWGPPHPD
ncbi:hypothetical protein IWQ55_006177 [Labrenzia sp. EL_208]|nr:hypothetical protein [Labrenzia sp. EL_132]MBG6211558.1 hypothetical protein [Labrenzia sp. EL_126]MBG6232943.1 hypothetical protein [Labrenzia sp. EL_208]